jgi:hypothetical protein
MLSFPLLAWERVDYFAITAIEVRGCVYEYSSIHLIAIHL